jgi:hypothetical protein
MVELPNLPDGVSTYWVHSAQCHFPSYSETQVRAYALEAIKAERAACALLAFVNGEHELAAAIRARGEQA